MNARYLLPAVVAIAAVATPAAAVQVTPVSVTASNTFPFFGQYKPENLIDGSGLSGGLHDSDYTSMWMTDQIVQQATLTFDLGQVLSLNKVDIWNYNFGTPGYLSLLERGAKDFTVAFSTDGISFTQVLAGTLAMGTGGALAAQSFDLTGAARYVQLNLLNNHATDPSYIPYTATGLAEVSFGAVPEPATWAMMISGFGLVGGAMRRKRAQQAVFA